MANTAPIAKDDLYTINEDEVLKIAVGSGVLKNDTDAENDKLAAALLAGPENLLFKINTNGAFTYDARYHGQLWVDPDGPDDGVLVDPAEDDNEVLLPEGFNSLAAGATITDTFTYTAYDGQAYSTATATVIIIGMNDAPVATDDAATVVSGGTVTFAVVDDDTDVDIWPTPDTLSATELSDVDDGNEGTASGPGTTITTDAGGTATILGDGTVQYIAAADFFGVDTFIYKLEDGKGGSDEGVVRITVTPDNADPTATDDSYTIGEDDGETLFDDPTVLFNDSDPDSGDILAAQLVAGTLRRVDASGDTIAGNTGILVDFNTDGTFSYDPNGEFEELGDGESAYVAYDYDAFDAEGVWSRATVTIEIEGANDPVDATIPTKNALVYEAGLSTGSTDGLDTITQVFDFTTELKTLTAADPEGDKIFLTLVDSEGNGFGGVGSTSAGSGSYGTFTLIDAYDNETGAAGADGYVDGVSYTLSSNATHANVAGHNGGIFDLLNLGISDGTLATDSTLGGTRYELNFDGTPNATAAQAEVIDDITLLGQGPDGAAGNAVSNGTVAFTAGSTVTDTFTFIPGADGAQILFSGIPDTFTIPNGNGGITVKSVVNGLTVTGYTDYGTAEQAEWYTLVVSDDATANDDIWQWKYTQVQGPPAIFNPFDFSSVSAGGPKDPLILPTDPVLDPTSTITFDGFWKNVAETDGSANDYDLFDVTTFDGANESQDDINPNSAGGIGVGDGNVSLQVQKDKGVTTVYQEGIWVDLSQYGGQEDTSGISFQLTRKGNSPSTVKVL